MQISNISPPQRPPKSVSIQLISRIELFYYLQNDPFFQSVEAGLRSVGFNNINFNNVNSTLNVITNRIDGHNRAMDNQARADHRLDHRLDNRLDNRIDNRIENAVPDDHERALLDDDAVGYSNFNNITNSFETNNDPNRNNDQNRNNNRHIGNGIGLPLGGGLDGFGNDKNYDSDESDGSEGG